jgi:hypothetical protein
MQGLSGMLHGSKVLHMQGAGFVSTCSGSGSWGRRVHRSCSCLSRCQGRRLGSMPSGIPGARWVWRTRTAVWPCTAMNLHSQPVRTKCSASMSHVQLGCASR